MQKLINFNEETARKIQAYADKYTNGNFTAALNVICAMYLKQEEEKDESRSNRK